jgi:hypothetical protein
MFIEEWIRPRLFAKQAEIPLILNAIVSGRQWKEKEATNLLKKGKYHGRNNVLS